MALSRTSTRRIIHPEPPDAAPTDVERLTRDIFQHLGDANRFPDASVYGHTITVQASMPWDFQRIRQGSMLILTSSSQRYCLEGR